VKREAYLVIHASRFTNALLATAAQFNGSLNLGGCREAIPLRMNKERWEKDTDARRGRRCPDDRRRWIINSFTMAIVAIRSIHRPAVVITTASVLLVTAVVLFVIFAVGRHHVYNADH
jgi:hypothetical protein